MICISQGVIIFCAPNKTNEKKKPLMHWIKFLMVVVVSFYMCAEENYDTNVFTHPALSNFQDIGNFLQGSTF